MKTRSIILLVAMLFVVVLAFASCDLFHQHTWQDATCTTPKTCTECGETEGEALGHAEEVLEGKNATCTEEGLTEGKKCSACGEILVAQETIPTTAHTEEVVAGKAPTCTATGLTEGKKCSVCDKILVAQEEIPMAAHTEEVVPGKDATCTETGLTAGKKCSVCDATLEAQTELSKLPHTYDEGWDEDCNVCGATRTCAHDGEKNILPGKAPTCTDAGLTDGETCAICGDVIKAQTSIEKLGHDMSDATCTAASKCQRCSYVEGEALGHDYDEGVITVKPGCETKGVKTFTCQRPDCGYSYEVDVEATGHSYVDTVVPATCISKGYTEHVCSGCGDSYKDNETALAEHTYEGKVTTAPECEKEGVKTYTCTVKDCGHSYTEAIEATGHSEIAHEGKAATCTEDGYEAYVTCANCDYTTYKSISALGHKGGKATCKDLATCDVCGEKYGTIDKVNGHHYGEADCESPATCELCGATSGSAIGHIDENKDHVCDRTACDEAMGTCEDADKDHTCDYGCGKSYGTCEDANKDHACDYGCNKVYGTCEDENKDHACDYGCKKVFGTHADGDDKNHTCDYGCLEPVEGEVCVDENKNHVCDECSGRVGGDCADDQNGQDNDHLCDYCGASVGEACHGGTATCTNKAVCVECGKEYGELLAHTYDQTKAVEAAIKTKADCENSAVYYYSCSCGAVNKAEGAATFEAGEPLGHTEETVAGKAATCTATGLSDGIICSVCNKTLKAQEVLPVIPHTEEILAGKDATCDDDGLTEGKKCSVCGAVIKAQEVVPALGHKYGEITYVWSADNSTCTATTICGNDASHIITETVTVTTVKLNLSGEKITFTYNVEFANEAFAAQSKTVDGEMSVENKIATVYAPAIAGRVASHDYVKFGLHNAEETHEFTIYYSEVDVWDGTSVSESLQGSGTLEDPYLIQSAADFAYFAAQLNNAEVGQTENFKGQYFKMTKSIDLGGNLLIAGNHSGWNKYQGFGGTFDGNNCSIRGINVEPTTGTSSALFGCITAAGTLKNLSVYGNVKGVGTVGGVVAYQLGAVDNVTSYVTVTATDGTVGGVVANQESSAGILSNCVNYGNVSSTSYIVGGVAGSGGATITNCVNWGNVQAGAEKIGGIAGETKASGAIEGCTNYGNVTMTVAGKGYVGGIAGNAIKPISNCVNYGTITGVNTTGGIAGLSTALVDNCVNYGTVIASSWNIGGISGRASGGIQNSINYADVTSTGSGTVGGIVGTAQSNISGCENRGTVKGSGQCGGIVGVFSNNANITDCINYGEVNGAWATAGIAGYSTAGSSTISGCENHGKVLCSTTSNGGIVGLAAEKSVVTISDCINRGDVSGISWGGGGIAGEIVAGSISGCTNYGTISGDGQLGGIAGKSKVNVSGCINYGKVIAAVDVAGGICADTTGEIANCENNGAIVGNCSCVIVDGISPSNVTKTECVNNGTITINHSLTHVDAVAPTCKEAGIVAHEHCSACGKNFDAEGNQLESVEDPILDHTEEVVPGKAATCTEDGLTDGKKCSVCGVTLVAQDVIPAGHKDEDSDGKCDACGNDMCEHVTETVIENVVEATCEADGSYDNVVKCTKCGAQVSKETVVVDALGHAYGDVSYAWASDNSSCTASKVCANDASHVLSEMASIPTVVLNVSATKVTYTYSAVFASEGLEAQTKVVEADVTLANSHATINAPAIAGRTASHEYVKFGFHDAAATYEFTIYYSEVDVWDGTSVSESLQGSGTEEDPYLIQSAADLAYVAKVVNEAAKGTANFSGQYFKMTKSIDLNGKELLIGTYAGGLQFQGYFDGNNCSIKGMKSSQALFGYVKNGYVKNLSVYGTVTSTTGRTGGVVSYLTAATVENVTNYATVSGTNGLAGVVGWLESSTTSSAINCVNYGTVSGTSYQVGGIAGFAKGNLTNCTNFGDVTSTKSGYVGGIGGTANDAKGSRSNCVNYGNISGTDYVGGCFGTINKTTTDCYSYGTATIINSTKTNVGDVVGGGASYLTYTTAE